MRVRAMAVAMPDVPEHPNRVPFEGVLTLVDEPSTRPPAGARGHKVVLTRTAAMAALPTLLGMAIDYTPAWDGHDARRKCGVITEADVVGRELQVSGYLYAKDFPEVEQKLREAAPGIMGMSYELANAHVEDMQARTWMLTRATFTGAAVLLREKAAYQDTHFALAPKRCRSFNAARPRREAARPASGVAPAINETQHRSLVTKPGKDTRWKSRNY